MSAVRLPRAARMLHAAHSFALGSTCPHRQVGCVLADANGVVLATGHNGVAAGEPHCSEGHPCGGEGFATGEGLDACAACHAEINALTFNPDPAAVDVVYLTASPCAICVRYLLNTSARAIAFAEEYDRRALDRWVANSGVRLRAWGRVDREGRVVDSGGGSTELVAEVVGGIAA